MLGRATVAAATALVLTALSSPAAWAADPTPQPTPSVGAENTQPPAESEQTKAVRAALQKAKDTGKPVRIDAMTDETTEVYADTDGRTLYSEAHAQDVRTKRTGSWQKLDPTLRSNANGTVTPALTGSDLVLSGGGTGPLAKITTADGASMSITAPFPLPAPTLKGATATYVSVLPDVDLQVTARPDGGWRDVIVVKTAAAAADPRLKSLHFPLQTSGVKADTDAAGNISFKDSQGKERFHAPTPFQWDSSTVPAPSPLVKSGAAQPKSLLAAPGASETGTTGDVSTAEQPGAGAAVSAMGVATSETELVLTPDRSTFGQGTGPWYLDPETSVNGGSSREVNAEVQENHPDTENVNKLSTLGVGYCGYSNCTGYGRYRAYYQMSVPSALFEGGGHGTATVTRSTLFVPVTDASETTYNSKFNLYHVPALQGTTTWNKQPCGTGSKMAGCTPVGDASITNTGTMEYNVQSWMQMLVNAKAPNWTIGFSADDEYNKSYRHHFGADPYITTYYDITPTIWWPRTTPTPGFVNDPTFGTQRNDCQTPGGGYAWYQPGWVGANQAVYLNANVWSPIGATVTTKFHLWDDNDGNVQLWPETKGAGSYGTGTVPVDRLTDGHQYGWTSAATDDLLSSAAAPACYFRVDKTPPQVSISSTDFPASGTIGAAPGKKVREAGSFKVTAQDPAPASGLGASGVACIRWSTDPTAVTGWSCDAEGIPNNNGVVKGFSGTFAFTPSTWGTNTLFVQAMDVAGNYSQPLPYTFYAPWDTSIGTGTPGDLNGDGRGDVLLPDDLGNLRIVGLDSDATNLQAAPLGLAPGGTTWKSDPATGVTVKTTHLGALREMPSAVDDAIVWTSATSGGTSLAKNLYLYENNGDGTFKAPALLTKPKSWVDSAGNPLSTAPAGWNTAWTGLTQVVSLGSLHAGLNDTDSLTTINQTSLLTVEGGNLWLYRAQPTDRIGAPALKVSSLNWDNYELINPGAASGTAQPTLWTRDRTDGTIRAYDITLNANGFLNFSGLADPSQGRVVGTQKFTVAAYPQVGSSGDATKDGLSDLWTLDAANHLKLWPGAAAAGSTKVTGFSATPADQGDTRRALGRIKLDNPAVTDVYGKYPMTASSAVTFPTDTVNGKSTTVAHFAGKNSSGADSGSVIDYSAAQTSRLTVDTSKSFTVSVWAKPGTGDGSKQGPVLSTKGTASSGFILWPDVDNNWRFGMAASDNASWSYDMTVGSSAARFQQDRWDRLTASYNANTGVMTLYVNGMLAGSAVHSGKFGYSAPLVIGNYQNAGAYVGSFNGNVSDAVVYDVPTNPGSVTGRLVADLPPAVGSNKCLDANGGVDANGTAIQIWDCNDSTAQKATAQPNGTVKILSRCLDVTGAATGNGTKIQLWNCDGNPAQQWVFRADGSLYNPNSGRCLDIPNGNITNGTQLQIWDCNQTYPQRWRSGTVA